MTAKHKMPRDRNMARGFEVQSKSKKTMVTFAKFKTPQQVCDFINKTGIRNNVISISTGQNFITVYYLG